MLKLPLSFQQVSGPLLVALLAAALFMLEPAASEWLAYDRYQVQSMETWRLITANLLHTNGYHLLLNIAGVCIVWGLHGDYYRLSAYLRIFLLCGIGCTVGIYWFSPSLIWYVGLSGALHGIFAWGACLDIVHGLRSGWLLLAGMAVKIGYEQVFGFSDELATLIDASVAVDAHLYGAISGLLVALLGISRFVWRNKQLPHISK